MNFNIANIFNKLFFLIRHYQKSIRTIILIILGVTLGVLIKITYYNIYKSLVPNPKFAIKLILIDLLLLLSILSIVLSNYLKNSSLKQEIFTNNKIQKRTVTYFSIIAVIPAMIVSAYSIFFFHNGVENWFNSMIKRSFEESVSIAKSYLNEHELQINSEARSISFFVDYLQITPYFDYKILDDYLTKIAEEKGLADVIVFQLKPLITISKSKYSFNLAHIQNNQFFELIDAAENNVVITKNYTNKITTIIRLNNFKNNTYLLISKLLNHEISNYLKKTEESYNEFIKLNANTNRLKLEFYATFVLILTILVFCAYFLGHYLAYSILRPIHNLIYATKEIQKGNYNISLIPKEENEISTLQEAFNMMALQISQQRDDLIKASHKIAFRNHFNETVISNISSGVIVVNYDYYIKVINPPAKNALYIQDQEVNNHKIDNYFPEIMALLDKKILSPSNTILQEQLIITRNRHRFILLIRISSEIFEGFSENLFITFDDITALIRAQEQSAWSDLARRIAHEIKNPLTPIHLAAQRIEKKYAQEVSEPNMLIKYTQTITRHVIQIGNIIEDFVSFARNKSPNLKTVNVSQLIDEVVFSRRCLDNNINYIINIDRNELILECDSDQIVQVLTNIIKNSEESYSKDENLIKQITIYSIVQTDYFQIIIEDNGNGFHIDMYNKLTEPYITNKTHGSGLGLAIVKKIMDSHNANINFENLPNGGAKVILTFKKATKIKKE